MKLIKDKKGGLYLGVMFAIFFLILGMLMISFLDDTKNDARTDLDCNNSSISNGNKATCLIVDTGVPYFIIAILMFVGGIVGKNL